VKTVNTEIARNRQLLSSGTTLSTTDPRPLFNGTTGGSSLLTTGFFLLSESGGCLLGGAGLAVPPANENGAAGVCDRELFAEDGVYTPVFGNTVAEADPAGVETPDPVPSTSPPPPPDVIVNCSPSSLTGRSESGVDAGYSSRVKDFGGKPYLMSRLPERFDFSRIWSRRLPAVVSGGSVRTWAPAGLRILMRMVIAKAPVSKQFITRNRQHTCFGEMETKMNQSRVIMGEK
jgi:hypothetical protein